MPDTFQGFVVRILVKNVRHVWFGKGNPTDDSFDQRLRRGNLQESIGFCDHLPSLDGDKTVYTTCSTDFTQLFAKEIVTQNGHVIVDPAVLFRGIFPEVVVAVDQHRLSWASFFGMNERMHDRSKRSGCQFGWF